MELTSIWGIKHYLTLLVESIQDHGWNNLLCKRDSLATQLNRKRILICTLAFAILLKTHRKETRSPSGFQSPDVICCTCHVQLFLFSGINRRHGDISSKWQHSWQWRHQLCNSFVLSNVDLYLAWCLFRIMEIDGNGNTVGNGDINFVTPLSQVVLTLYLAWCLFRSSIKVIFGMKLFRMIGISHKPCCYSN